ncbi:hypothetical protein D3C76_1361280 [compost metagenome]
MPAMNTVALRWRRRLLVALSPTMIAMLPATMPASSQKPSGSGRRIAAPVAQPGSRYATDQPAPASRLTAKKRGKGMSNIPATIGSIGRRGPMKRPTSRLAIP